MNNPTNTDLERHRKTERLHALDSLRAIMMLLGLVLHSALAYVTFNTRNVWWGIKDTESTHRFFDLLINYIHSFRMPVFFVIAGFFGALLFYERSQKVMLQNRLNRIVLPFVVFVILLWPLVNLSWTYTFSVMHGAAWPLDRALRIFSKLPVLPTKDMHLWFLYYLIFYSMAGWFLESILEKSGNVHSKIQGGFEFLMQFALLRPLLFASTTFALFYFTGSTWIEKSSSFTPYWKPLLFFFIFYIFGWFLYGSKKLVADFIQFDWLLVAVATTAFFLKRIYFKSMGDVPVMVFNSLIIWCFVFGIIGLFIRYFSYHSPKMRLMSDSSYWFFLIHLPLTVLFPAFLMGTGLPVWLKFVLVLGATSIVCWVTYIYFVRSSFIGKFLNGKKHSRNKNYL
jgi:hypothetical protein